MFVKARCFAFKVHVCEKTHLCREQRLHCHPQATCWQFPGGSISSPIFKRIPYVMHICWNHHLCLCLLFPWNWLHLPQNRHQIDQQPMLLGWLVQPIVFFCHSIISYLLQVSNNDVYTHPKMFHTQTWHMWKDIPFPDPLFLDIHIKFPACECHFSRRSHSNGTQSWWFRHFQLILPNPSIYPTIHLTIKTDPTPQENGKDIMIL